MARQTVALAPAEQAARPGQTGRAWRGTLVRGLALATQALFLLTLAILPLDVYLTLPAQENGIFLTQVLAIETGLLLAATLIAGRLLSIETGLRFTWADLLPLGLVLLAAMASIVFATSRSVAVKDSLKVLVFLSLYVLARALRDVPELRRRALIVVLGSFVVVLVSGLLGLVHGLPDVAGELLNIHRSPAAIPFTDVLRAEATFRYPNELAAYLLIVLVLLVSTIVAFPWWLERSAGLVILALGAYLLVATYTRGALVAIAIVVPILLYLLGGKRLAALGAVALALAGVGVLLKGGISSGRIFSIFSPGDSGYSERFAAWRWALEAFRHRPLFGVGIGNLPLQPDAPYINQALGLREVDAENLFLNVLAEMGLFGLVAVVYCLGGALWRAWRGLHASRTWVDRAWNTSVFAAIGALLIFGLGDPVLLSGQVAGLLCVAVGLVGVQPAPAAVTAQIPAIERAPDILGHLGIAGVPGGGLPVERARVVFLINAPRYGGAEQHSMNLAAELWRRGRRVLVVVPPQSPLLPLLRAQKIPCRSLALGMNIGRWRGFLGTAMFLNPLSRRRAMRRLTGLAREEPSIFVCPFLREQLLATRLGVREGSAVVWVLHSTLVYWPHRQLRALWVKLAREADAVTTVSPRFAEEVRALGFPSERLEIIPSSVPDALLERDPAIQPTSGLIVAVSRLVQTKGIQHLIATLPRVLERHPAARLAIAGTGRYEPELRKRVRQLGLEDRVTFLGYVPEPATILRQASLFVCPSVDPGEVLPASILEAFAVGVPVVASSLASIPEIVVDGTTGRLTWPGDEGSLAEAIIALLDDPAHARALGAAGRELVRARYTFGQTGAKFLQLLDGLGQEQPVAEEDLGPTPSAIMRAVHRPRLLGGTALFATSKVLTALGTALWTILAARVLLPATYGDLMLAMGLVELGATVTDAGLTAVATRELARATDAREVRVLTSTLLSLKLVLGLAAMAVTVIVTLLLPFPGEVHRLVFVLAPSLVFVSINSMTLVFRARLAFRAVLAVSLITALLTIYSSFVVYILFPSDVAFAQARLVVAALAGLVTLAILLVWYRPSLRFSPRVARTLLAAAVAFGLSQVLNIFFVRIDVPLLALLGGNTQVAVYTSAYRIVDVVSLLPVSAAGVALPLMASIGLARRPHLRAFAQQYLELAVIAGGLVALALSLWGDPILALLYDGRYADAGPVLRILGWASAAMFVTNVFTPLVVALDHRRTLMVATACGLVANVGLNLVLIPRLGPAGPAWATLVTELVVTAPLAWVSVRTLRWRVDAYTMVAAVEAALFALAVSLALRHLPGWQVGVLTFGLWALAFFILAPGWVVALVRSLQQRPAPRGPAVSRARRSGGPSGSLSPHLDAHGGSRSPQPDEEA